MAGGSPVSRMLVAMTTDSALRWRQGLALCALAVGAWIGLAWWCWQGREVSLPDAPSQRIACVSYAPFRYPGTSPLDPRAHVSPRQIDADLRQLSHRFDCVRTYAQGQGLDAVPRIARRYGMKVLLGIWLSADPRANAREIKQGIATARANRDVVRAIVVGNEVLLRGDLPPGRLVADIERVKRATGIPVTYADVWAFWLRYAHTAGLARAVSFVTIHVLPYWEDHPVPVSRAVAHLAQVYARVRAAIPGKTVLIGETGWPSAGRPRRGAVPSRVNEARYIREFLAYAARSGVPYNLIESYDQPWKRRLEGTVGGYWGLYDAQGRPKFALRGPVVNLPHWWRGVLASLMLGLLFAFSIGRRWRERGVAALVGIASGAALAAAFLQMWQALIGFAAWAVGIMALAAALSSAWWLTRSVVSGRRSPPAGWRFIWLFAVAYVDLLLDGRYRDFPVALMLVPACAWALHDLVRRPCQRPGIEAWTLGGWLPVAALVLLVEAGGLNASVWLWAAVNLLLAWPTWGVHRSAGAPGAAVPPAQCGQRTGHGSDGQPWPGEDGHRRGAQGATGATGAGQAALGYRRILDPVQAQPYGHGDHRGDQQPGQAATQHVQVVIRRAGRLTWAASGR
jgi:exo-beta-1,3-glucanase (GH17 family)